MIESLRSASPDKLEKETFAKIHAVGDSVLELNKKIFFEKKVNRKDAIERLLELSSKLLDIDDHIISSSELRDHRGIQENLHNTCSANFAQIGRILGDLANES